MFTFKITSEDLRNPILPGRTWKLQFLGFLGSGVKAAISNDA